MANGLRSLSAMQRPMITISSTLLHVFCVSVRRFSSVRIHLTTGESVTKNGQAIRTGFIKESTLVEQIHGENELLNETRADCLTMFCPRFSCC